jgi:hypothetical protein
VVNTENQPYRMSFGLGGLFINESVDVARLHISGEPWENTIVRAMEEGTTSMPKSASQRRTLREIVNRLSALTEAELALFAETDDRTEQQALLWLAACRAYRFVGEFAIEILRERYLSYRLELSLNAFDIFWEEKAEWHSDVADISKSTRLKLRQVLYRMMREADILSAEDKIQTAYLTPRLKALIVDHRAADLAVFPGVSVEVAST